MPETYLLAAGYEDLAAQAVTLRAEVAAMGDRAGPLVDDSLGRDYRIYELLPGGIAVIPIEGLLLHDWPYLFTCWGITGYASIDLRLSEALQDPEVRGILLHVNSPGGTVAGCFDLADRIRTAGEQKPVWAALDENAYSAAYLLASQAGVISVPRTGGGGSIGAVWLHVEYSRALEKDGYTVTPIIAGKHKVDGNPYEPLPPEVKARREGELEEIRQLFAETVGLGRGSLFPASRALETEAQCLTAREALEQGLVDAILSPRELVTAFVGALDAVEDSNGGATAKTEKKGAEMSGLSRLLTGGRAGTRSPRAAEDKEPDGDEGMEDDSSEDDAAEGDGEDGEGSPEDDGEDDDPPPEKETPEARAVRDDRVRFAAVLALPEAAGRENLARTLAADGFKVKAAKKILAAAPKSSGLSGASRKDQLGMVMPENPDVGADGGGGAGGNAASAWGRSIARVTGCKPLA